MENNWDNFSEVAFLVTREIFRSSRGGGGIWPKWPNGKYACGVGASHTEDANLVLYMLPRNKHAQQRFISLSLA